MRLITLIVKMQIAIDSEKNQEITAREAFTGVDYYCVECGGVLRVRKTKKKASFHHFKPHKKKKTLLEHTLIQQEIFKRLPHTHIEYPLPQINRKADVLDLEKKWVYEVQCSPISLKEVKNREKDYAHEGLTVIWILHDAKFNRKRKGAAEKYLISTHGCYYVTCGPLGVSLIYNFDKKRANLTEKPTPRPLKKPKKKKGELKAYFFQTFDRFLKYLAYKQR